MVGSNQKSVVRQLKQMGLCRPSKSQQRRGGSDLCWQTVPRPRRSHLKGATTWNWKARSPRVTRRVGGTSSVVVSAERRWRRATNSDVGRRLSARYAGSVPCTEWYARTHKRNYFLRTTLTKTLPRNCPFRDLSISCSKKNKKLSWCWQQARRV